MEISKAISKYMDDIVRISYRSYYDEISLFKNIPVKSFEDFKTFMLNKMQNMDGYVYLEENKCRGYLIYNAWEDGDDLYCSIPEWGCGSDSAIREKVISHLFQALAEGTVKEKTVNFSVSMYAHDIEIQRLFSYMEFGIQAETGIRFLKETEKRNDIKIRRISTEEIEKKWNEIWKLLSQLIDHLKESPVFYPGEEFTEEVYRDFFIDAGTRVYVAENRDEMIGLIEANEENISLVFSENEAANVGEAFVLPEFRGKGIAQALLNYAEQDLLLNDYRYVWVEHGTANPNARYFWNKYFMTYKYEMVRKIVK